MSDLRDLYQQVILDHQKKPRNFRALPIAHRHAEGFNPLCGDKVQLFLKMENGVIQDVGFQGTGCAISTASASMMTESIKGKTPAEAEAIFKKFQNLVTSDPHQEISAPELGKLEVFTAAINGHYAWLAVLAVVNTVASLFYYLRWLTPALVRAQEHEPLSRW